MSATREEEILSGLNAEQCEVVLHDKGPLRVGAVAGAGKTSALVRRIAYLVDVREVDPASILAVTFSTRAAKEMNDRLRALRIDTNLARVGTWHSLCWQIVREESRERWEVDKRDKYRTILKEVCGFKGMKWESADITVNSNFVTRCKANNAAPDSEKAREIAVSMSRSNPKSAIPNLMIEAFGRAEVERRDQGLITFDDMLVDAARYLSNESTCDRWSSRWDYVLQDEAQDESPVQQQIAESLAARHGCYMVVGDPAQSIYGFRGSDPKSLVTFDQRWPESKSVYMHRNYRSGSKILDVANATLRAMSTETRLEMELTASRAGEEQGTVKATVHEDAEDEARSIAADLMAAVADGSRWSDQAILYRTNAQSRAIEEALLGDRIPYLVLGGTSFYMRKEVRCLLGYLRIATPGAKWDDVKRTLNAPFRFLGHKFLDRVKDSYDCGKADTSWPDAVRTAAQEGGVWAKQRASAETYAALVDSIAAKIETARTMEPSDPSYAEACDEAKPSKLLQEVLAETGYVAWLRRDEGTDSAENDRVTNVRELIRAAERFADVAELLTYVDDQIDRAEKAAREHVNEDVVLLMSIHKSKGLEWPRVFLAGAIEGVIPHGKSEDPQEERRLFYVATTRARDYFRVSATRRGAFGGKITSCTPSSFIAEAGLSVAGGLDA